MKIEVLQAKGCEKCMRELESLRTAAQQADANVEWKELVISMALDSVLTCLLCRYAKHETIHRARTAVLGLRGVPAVLCVRWRTGNGVR